MAVFKLLSWFFLLLVSVAASAADITTEKLVDGPLVIRLNGELKAGDDERFRRISLRHPTAVVHLESNGGALVPALEIGRIIRIAGYNTVVLPTANCASACALIWLAGKKRYIFGNVGFHAAYRDNDGRLQESGAANALIGNYMTLLGFPAKAIVFATAAPPNKVLWLTPDSREVTGIDFELPVAPPPIRTSPQTTRGQASPAPAVLIPPSVRRSTGIRVLDKKFFLTKTDGTDLYLVTFLYRGLRLQYPIDIYDNIENKLKDFFEDELKRYDGWINIYLDGDLNKWEMVGYDIHYPSLSRNRNVVEVWVKEDHEFNKMVRHRSDLMFMKFYCGERALSIFETTKYDPQGKIVSSEEFSGLKNRIPPDTVFEPVYNAVCP